MVNYDGLYNREFFGDKLNETHFSDKKLHFRIIENGTILPHLDLDGRLGLNGFGGIIDGKGNFVEGTSVHEGIGDVYTPNEDLRISPETVIFLGTFNSVWGHCLTDHIKRLWFLTSDPYKRYFSTCKLAVNLMGQNIIPNFVKLLQVLEVDLSRLNIITHATKFQNVILPDPSLFYAGGGGRNCFTPPNMLKLLTEYETLCRKIFRHCRKKSSTFFTVLVNK
ncbi:MAG: DUF563 domain-containing protein [Selenomonadaceae bacterium]|nr:DUF563 domain-containing protein [Selenomonadaceae bacterium]